MHRWLKRLMGATKDVYTAALYWRVSLNAVKEAHKFLGCGEQGENNTSPWIRRTLKLFGWPEVPTNWCAMFVSLCFYEALTKVGLHADFYHRGAKRLTKNIAKEGRFLDKGEYPLAGDVICWNRGKNPKDSWKGHVGIVVQADNLGNITTIEGNRGPKGKAKVAEFHYTEPEWRKRLYGVARLWEFVE